MKNKIKNMKYENEEIGEIKIIEDFLPPPENLVLKKDTVKVTLLLSKESVDFFKSLAKKKNTQYQKMIRVLLDRYISHYAT